VYDIQEDEADSRFEKNKTNLEAQNNNTLVGPKKHEQESDISPAKLKQLKKKSE